MKGAARPAGRSGEFIVGFSSIPCESILSLLCTININIWRPLVAGDGGSEANYRVVDTDYDSYAIVYDCSPFPVIKKGEVVVMTEEVKIF